MRQCRTEDEPARFDPDHYIDRHIGAGLGQMSDRAAKRRAVLQQGRDITKHDTSRWPVWDRANALTQAGKVGLIRGCGRGHDRGSCWDRVQAFGDKRTAGLLYERSHARRVNDA